MGKISNQSLLDAALSYAANGVFIFPLKPGTKAPMTAHGVHDATIDPDAGVTPDTDGGVVSTGSAVTVTVTTCGG